MSGKKQPDKKRKHSCSSLGWSNCKDSCQIASEDSGSNANVVSKCKKTCKTSVTGSANSKANTVSEGNCTRFVYNKNVKPDVVDALLVKKFGKCDSKATETPRVISRVVLPSRKTAGELGVQVKSPVDKVFDNKCEDATGKLTPVEVTSTHKWAAKVISSPGGSVDKTTGSVTTDKASTPCVTTAKVVSVPRGDAEAGAKVSSNPNEL